MKEFRITWRDVDSCDTNGSLWVSHVRSQRLNSNDEKGDGQKASTTANCFVGFVVDAIHSTRLDSTRHLLDSLERIQYSVRVPRFASSLRWTTSFSMMDTIMSVRRHPRDPCNTYSTTDRTGTNETTNGNPPTHNE